MQNTTSRLSGGKGSWRASASRSRGLGDTPRVLRRATASISLEISAAMTRRDHGARQSTTRPVPHGRSTTRPAGPSVRMIIFTRLRSLQLLYRPRSP